MRIVLRIMIIAAGALAPQLAAAQSPALQPDELYKAETIVTGTGEAERMRGFRIGVDEVLVKLTGDSSLPGTKAASEVAEHAADLVADFTYEDRMKDIPVHDEQGTRDRPHFLRMRFDAAKFDAALNRAGLSKWTGERPTLSVWIGISEPRGKYVLGRAGGGYGQREVLKDASKKRGIPILLPAEDQTAVNYDAVAKGDLAVLRPASRELGGNAVLYGLLDFDGEAHWNTRWTVSGDRVDAAWTMNGVTFDAALKGAIERVAAAFSKQAR
jgi:uncharacterized protein